MTSNTECDGTPIVSNETEVPVPLGEIWRFFNVRNFELSPDKLEALKTNDLFRHWAISEWSRVSKIRALDTAQLPMVADDGKSKITRRIFGDYGEILVTFGRSEDPVTIALIPRNGVNLPNRAYLIIYREQDGMFGKMVLPKPKDNRYIFYIDSLSPDLALLCDRNSIVAILN